MCFSVGQINRWSPRSASGVENMKRLQAVMIGSGAMWTWALAAVLL